MWEFVSGAAFGLIVVSGGWVLLCNERTHRDRLRIIDVVFEWPRPDEWEALRQDYSSVTYDNHMWARVFLRNPFHLYSSRLQKALSQARAS